MFLRLLQLDFQPLWWDEGYSVWFATHTLVGMAALTAQDIHPPLYYALLHGWIQLLGPSPVALRLFSVVASLPAIPLAYLAVRSGDAPAGGDELRRLSKAGLALLAAAIVAVNPLHIYYSQEIRMYGLVGTLAMAYLWLVLPFVRPTSQVSHPRRRAAALLAVTTALLYTQYYAAMLPLAVTLFVLGHWLFDRRRGVTKPTRVPLFVATQVTAALLFIPWLLYAAPRLNAYVAYKVTQDADVSLDPVTYVLRHLSAFLVGHVEQPALATLLGVVSLAAVAVLMVLAIRQHVAGQGHGFALWVLGVVFLLGYLLNLRFPFAPTHGERLLFFVAPVFWLWLAVLLAPAGDGPAVSARPGQWARGGAGTALVMATIVALGAYYTTPRYGGEDYRPAMQEMAARGQAGDLVFSIYPWQVGYVRAYLPAGPQAQLSPTQTWNAAADRFLTDTLAAGQRVWFPAHLSLGGLLENEVEASLLRHGYPVLNRWISPSTRLTFFVPPPATWQSGPVAQFGSWLRLSAAQVSADPAASGEGALPVELTWQVSTSPPAEAPVQIRLALVDGQGHVWAQRDSAPANGQLPFNRMQLDEPTQDRHALWIPAGTPPGTYDLTLSVYQQPAAGPAQLLDVLDASGQPQGVETVLGQVTVTRPAEPLAAERLSMTSPRSQQVGPSLRFLGYDVPSGPWQPGEDVPVDLGWQVLASPAQDLVSFVQLLDDRGDVVAAWEGPGLASLPGTSWQAGDLLRTPLRLRIPATVATGQYRLISGLFDPASGQRLQPAGQTADYLNLGTVDVRARTHSLEPSQPSNAQTAQFGRQARLVGYDLSPTDLQAGQPVTLTLHWQAGEPWSQRARVFVHLLDTDDNIVASADSEPGGGRLPTTSWLPGEYLVDAHATQLPADLPPGEYRWEIGFYFDDGIRLPVVDEQGQVVGDRVVLGVGSREEVGVQLFAAVGVLIAQNWHDLAFACPRYGFKGVNND